MKIFSLSIPPGTDYPVIRQILRVNPKKWKFLLEIGENPIGSPKVRFAVPEWMRETRSD